MIHSATFPSVADWRLNYMTVVAEVCKGWYILANYSEFESGKSDNSFDLLKFSEGETCCIHGCRKRRDYLHESGVDAEFETV